MSAAMTPQRPDAAAILAALTGWPDLDTQLGLRSLAGKADRYLAMLARLVQTHGGDAQALELACSDGDLAELRRLAHRLAGAAGLLGAVTVTAAARRLDRPDLPELDRQQVRQDTEALAGALRRLVQGLSGRAGIAPAAPAAWPFPPAAGMAPAGAGGSHLSA